MDRKKKGTLLNFFKPNKIMKATIPAENLEAEEDSPSSPRLENIESSSVNSSVSTSSTMDISSLKKRPLSDEEKFHVLTNVWTPQEDFKFPATISGKQSRRFNHSWLKTYKWLRYSKQEDSAYCLPCVLFAPQEVGMTSGQQAGSLVKEGFRTWKKALSRFQEHETQNYHLTSNLKANNLKDVMLGKLLPIDKSVDKAKNLQAIENRKKIKPIIETIILCGRQGIALRGHRDYGTFDLENPPTENEGNVRALLRARIESGDVTLKEHFKSCGRNATYISWSTQNEIIDACDVIIKRKIAAEVQDAKFFTVLADETTDVSTVEQFSLCLRYVKYKDSSYFVCENFFQFQKLEGTTGQQIADAILSGLQAYNIDPRNMRGQGYDGAAAMSGMLNGVQAIISATYPSALYVHCMSHCLNLAISDSVEVPCMRNAFGIAQKISVFFNTPKRQQVLIKNVEELIPATRSKQLKELCPTRWVERHDAIMIVVQLLYPIAVSLEEISSWEDRDTSSKAFVLFNAIQRSAFIVSLLSAEKLLAYSLPLSQKLQSKSSDLMHAISLAKDVVAAVQEDRNHAEASFREIFENAQRIADMLDTTITTPRTTLHQTRRSNVPADNPEEYYRRSVYIPWVDIFISQMKSRFLAHENLLTNFSCLLPTGKIIDEDRKLQFSQLCDAYADDLPPFSNQSSRISEISLWFIKFANNQQQFPLPKNAVDALNMCDCTVYKNVHTLLKILCTLPITTSTAERSFSTLRRLKTYLRNTMSENRLNGLAMLNVHREIGVNYDEVIDVLLQTKSNRKLDFVL